MEEQNIAVSYDTDRNLLHDIYQEYQTSEFMKHLNDKYTPSPYYVQHQYTRLLALVASYVFNVFSALTAGTLVYFIGEELIGNKSIALVIVVSFMVLLEAAKRILASDICQRYFQFNIKISWNGLLLLVLFVMSVGCSFYGSQKFIDRFSDEYVAPESPSIISNIEDRISILESQIEAARKITYRDGRTTMESRQTILLLTTQVGDLEKEKIILEKDFMKDMNAEIIMHNSEIQRRAFWFALITLFFELCFVVSVWYLEYFDWRSWKEFECVDSLYTSSKQPVYTAKPKDFAVLNPESEPNLENERYIKSRIATAKYRIKNGIGNEETNRGNLEKFEEILSSLQVNQ